MYETTFEGFMVARLNEPVTSVETAYERHLREAWSAYDTELTQNYRKVADNG